LGGVFERCAIERGNDVLWRRHCAVSSGDSSG
jgi:hypothetical protein